jgi:hypothetical protein
MESVTAMVGHFHRVYGIDHQPGGEQTNGEKTA